MGIGEQHEPVSTGRIDAEPRPVGWRSVAVWPESVGKPPNNVSRDFHRTIEQATAVCDMLKRGGLGGERNVFPLLTYVEPVLAK